jgi:hypothetical protein
VTMCEKCEQLRDKYRKTRQRMDEEYQEAIERAGNELFKAMQANHPEEARER